MFTGVVEVGLTEALGVRLQFALAIVVVQETVTL
jgi:hypothetical protein